MEGVKGWSILTARKIDEVYMLWLGGSGVTKIVQFCQTIGSTGITAGIVVIDENYLEELSVSARQCAALYTQRKYSLCGAESL